MTILISELDNNRDFPCLVPATSHLSIEPLHPAPPSPTGPMSADGSLERALIPATCEEEDKRRRRGRRQPEGGLLKALSLPKP